MKVVTSTARIKPHISVFPFLNLNYTDFYVSLVALREAGSGRNMRGSLKRVFSLAFQEEIGPPGGTGVLFWLSRLIRKKFEQGIDSGNRWKLDGASIFRRLSVSIPISSLGGLTPATVYLCWG